MKVQETSICWFHSLNCSVTFFLQDIEDACKSERGQLSVDDTAFVFCILSHGANGTVYGADGRPLGIENLISLFDGKQCEVLRDRPKIFFIQACQGGLYSYIKCVNC
jgi:Caspase domain